MIFGWFMLATNFVYAQQATSGNEAPLVVRVVWGGGESQNWQGTINCTEGTMRIVAILGMEIDSGAGLFIDGQHLNLHAIRPAEFGGVDLELSGSASGSLEINLHGADSPDRVIKESLSVSQLIAADGDSVRFPLDSTGNVIDLRLANSNKFPVRIERSHLVFTPGEAFQFQLLPKVGQTQASSQKALRVRITPARKNETVSTNEFTIPTTESGLTEPFNVSVILPSEEGAWDVHLELNDASLPTRLGLSRTRLARTIQVVTVNASPRPLDDVANDIRLWREVQTVGALSNPWIPKLSGLPRVRFASGNIPGGSGVSTVERDGKSLTELAPGGWQALPLKISEIGKPHIVEVEYIDQGPMALGISILQPDDSGRTQPYDADSGVSVPENTVSGEPVIRRHQFFFWPRHKSPYLLFANRHATQTAVIGKIRILSGPNHLAPIDHLVESPADARQFLTFYEQPLFVDNFAVNKHIDPQTGYATDDWQSWLAGANRWTEYLKASGYTGAMLVVAGDGSSLYPGERIQPTPRFENGMLASSPVDPMRKDVVEMLLRVFAREGLQLVPVLNLNAPIPELEQLRNTGQVNNRSIVLENLSGETRLETWQRGAGEMSYYNPMDPVVQSTALEIVREFNDRYQWHRAWGGMGLLLSRNSLPVIPGQAWGVDSETVQRFAQDTGKGPIEQDAANEFISQVLNGDGRNDWLAWRQTQIGSWLEQVQQVVAGEQHKHKLYLLATDLFETQDAFSVLAPSLRRNGDVRLAAARIGLPMEAIAANTKIMFLRPYEIAPEKSLAESRLQYQLNTPGDVNSPEVLFGQGVLFSRRSSWAHFEKLQQSRPFGQPDSHPIMRLQPLVAAEQWSRQPLVESLLAGDPTVMVDGGWVIGFGQEQSTSGWIEQFTRLPAVPFTSIALASQSPVIVRQAHFNGKNWFYAANPTPWPITVDLVFDSNKTVVESLAGTQWTLETEGDSRVRLSLKLEPFDFQAGTTEPVSSIAGYQTHIDPKTTASLQERLDLLTSRISLAERAPPVEVLENAGFEPAGAAAPSGFGWFYDLTNNRSIGLQTESPLAGKASLVMTSEGTSVWIRSNEFMPTVTGRLSITVQLRTANPDNQPPLRISVQGNDGEQLYYRFGNVGLGEQEAQQIGREWKEFAVHFDDLPLSSRQPMRIGFDLMGAGHVEIDNVRVFDRWFDKQDSNAITQQLQVAGFQLTSNGNVDKCRRILSGYWPSFLYQYYSESSPGGSVPTPVEATAEVQAELRSSGAKTPNSATTGPRR